MGGHPGEKITSKLERTDYSLCSADFPGEKVRTG